MRRFLLLLLATSTMAVTISVAAGPAAGASGTRVLLRHTSLGMILTTGRGFTLYAFGADRRNHDRCVSIQGCASVWPLLKTSGTPTAGRGVKRSLLGTIKLAHGARQVTYAGHPLYTYSSDSGPGSTDYVGVNQFGGVWRALNAAGRLIR